MRLSTALICTALVFAAIPPQARPDEIDALLGKLRPPERFAGYVPDFSVRKKAFTLEYPAGPTSLDFYVVKDRDRYVALIPAPTGTITMLDFNPTTAPRNFQMPPERPRIETSLGSKLRTDAFIPTAVGSTEPTYQFTTGPGTLTLLRRYKGTSTFDKWTHRSETPLTIDTVNTFVFKCHPVFGYVVEATFDSRINPPPKTFEYFSAATSGICNVWAGDEAPARAVITPAHKPGFEGYYLNFPAIDLCDNDRDKFRSRNGGFAAFLNSTTGWSPATTLQGCEARFVVCNAHADLDFVTQWPADTAPDGDGLTHRLVRTRILALPPELTGYLWDNMALRFDRRTWVQMRIGAVEDFEDQPLPLTARIMGLISTGGGPKISENHARSGTKSAVIEGRFWPNLPQVPLRPGTRYRLEAWMKLVPWTSEQREAAEEKERAGVEKMRAQGSKVAPFRGFGPPEAYITAHLYESSPHQNIWLLQQQTSSATTETDAWQKVSLEFTAPKWGAYINIVFLANACTAYMDDFCLAPINPPASTTQE